MNKYTKYTD